MRKLVYKKYKTQVRPFPQHAPAAAAAAAQTRSSSNPGRGRCCRSVEAALLTSSCSASPALASVIKLSAAPFSLATCFTSICVAFYLFHSLLSSLLFCFAVLQLPFCPLSSSARPDWPWQRTSASASSSPAQNRQLNCTTFRGRERERHRTKAGHHYHYQDHYLLQSTLLTP